MNYGESSFGKGKYWAYSMSIDDEYQKVEKISNKTQEEILDQKIHDIVMFSFSLYKNLQEQIPK